VTNKAKALFLDRDGVINIDTGYVHHIDNFIFIDGIFDIARMAISKGYLIFVVTNQAGIGRGYYSEGDFKILTSWMLNKFNSEGVEINKVYFSPYHPIHGIGKYKKNHSSRKPNPGMFLKAESEYDLNLNDSILIGDKITDIQAGVSAGVGINLYLSNNLLGGSLNKKNCYNISSITCANNFL
jgi:D-glycero-D-manno-heptose 1,7-bisphosphate phosphatase